MTIDYDNEKKRAEIFAERGTTVHISKTDGRWHNGLILEIEREFFVLKDRMDGSENLIFFSELKKPIERFKEAGK